MVPPKPHLPHWQPPWVAAFEPTWVPPWELAFAAQSEATQPPGPDQEPHDPGDYEPQDYLYECDPAAFAEDHPYWDEEPPEPEDDTITVRPGERIPSDAGELIKTYYAPGIGDVRVYERLDPNEMDLEPDQIIEPRDLKQDFNLHFRPKKPKPPE